ncbi:hypothetical protein Dimus_027125, partial [Dionaea muscipula]
ANRPRGHPAAEGSYTAGRQRHQGGEKAASQVLNRRRRPLIFQIQAASAPPLPSINQV